MKSTMSRMITAAVAAVASASLLVACAASAPEPGDGTGGTDANVQPVDITLALNPAAQFVPVYYGLEQGIFEAHGINLTIVPQTDVAAIVSGVASGQYDFGFSTVVQIINANLNNIPIRAVATTTGQQITDEADAQGVSLVARADSGIQSAGDLGGKTLAVVGLSSLNTLATWDLAAQQGVDPASITLVQLPFGQMPAALANGDVDAAVIQAPFIAPAVADGGIVVGKPNVETFPNAAIGLFIASQDYIDRNEDIVQRFSDAVIESQEGASANIAAAQDTLVEQLGISEEAARQTDWNSNSDPRVNLAGFEKAQQLLIKYGGQTEELDVSTLVWPGALK